MREFSEQDLAYFRQRLFERRRALSGAEAGGREAARTVELDQSRVGRLSRMDALQGQAMSRATNQRRDQELRRVAAALKRLDEGDFGDCVECGEPVARGRLEADPAAALCIACAEAAEAGG